MTKDTKVAKIAVNVSYECKKQLKILALTKDTTLALLVKDILDSYFSKKIKSVPDHIE